MPTPKKGPRLASSPAHERLMLANMATSLFQHGPALTGAKIRIYNIHVGNNDLFVRSYFFFKSSYIIYSEFSFSAAVVAAEHSYSFIIFKHINSPSATELLTIYVKCQ